MIEALNQLAIAFGFFDGAQVSALDVFDQRQFVSFAIAHLTDNGRHHMELGHLRGPPAAFTGDQLVSVAGALLRAHQDRLHQPLGADGVGKLGQSGLVEPAPRLPGTRIDPFDRQFGQSGDWFGWQRRRRCLCRVL